LVYSKHESFQVYKMLCKSVMHTGGWWPVFSKKCIQVLKSGRQTTPTFLSFVILAADIQNTQHSSFRFLVQLKSAESSITFYPGSNLT